MAETIIIRGQFHLSNRVEKEQAAAGLDWTAVLLLNTGTLHEVRLQTLGETPEAAMAFLGNDLRQLKLTTTHVLEKR